MHRPIIRQLQSPHAGRSGTTTVEMAFALPILFAILLGAIDCARLNMLRNTVENAAYEGARRGILPGADSDGIREAAEHVLKVLGARDVEIEVTPETIDEATKDVTVTIDVPLEQNSWLASCMMCGQCIRKSCTLSRERLQVIDQEAVTAALP